MVNFARLQKYLGIHFVPFILYLKMKRLLQLMLKFNNVEAVILVLI